MKIYQVTDPEFTPYGRVISGYNADEFFPIMENTPVPEEVIYEASVPELEKTKAAADLADGIFGQMPIQVGFCNGHNQKLNALEYHRNSEINIAVNDLLLLLAAQQEIKDDYTLDTSLVKAFFIPEGCMVELFATTLHYAPCQTGRGGFRCIVILPRGTNAPLEKAPKERWGEEKLITAKNKWLIAHQEAGLSDRAWIGLKGENITITEFDE